jgi:hypothetical protein
MKKLVTTMLALSASAVMGLQVAHGECVRVNFENWSGRTIQRLYISPSTFRGWGDDVLGDNVLNAGRYTTVSRCFDSYDDDYDFKAVYADGGVDEWRQGVSISGNGTVWVDYNSVLHSR